MKVSDVVAQFLVGQRVKHVFVVSGGADLHLIDSLAKTKGIDYVCAAHEQGAAFAADGYARMTGGLGVAMATSGPGMTNLLTGVASSYYDSIPILFITGQVASFRAKGETGVRQMGFQESDTLAMVAPITKYAARLTSPTLILYELQKAVHLAFDGRPGPVLLDIPDDLQRAEIDPGALLTFRAPRVAEPDDLIGTVDGCLSLLRRAERPVLILGWGVHLAHAEESARTVVDRLGIPVTMTWAALDLVPSGHPLALGGFGTHGGRPGNLAVQNADLIISVGSRLDTKATGSPASSFARGARIVMVDLDPCETAKFERLGRPVDGVHADAGAFLRALAGRPADLPEVRAWHARIAGWKDRYPACAPSYADEPSINPYVLVKTLSEMLDEGEILFSETGCALAWMMQGFEFRPGQRFFHMFNNTPMGYGLPGAIGAALARPGQRIILVAGDGSLQMNIQEMATVVRHNLPIKIILLNNHGYSMVQQSQDQWLGSAYHATSYEGGLADPDLEAVARAYGLVAGHVDQPVDLRDGLRALLDCGGPALLNVEIDGSHRVIPQTQFGRPNEDAAPLLPRAEFLSNMIVQPLPVSVEE